MLSLKVFVLSMTNSSSLLIQTPDKWDDTACVVVQNRFSTVPLFLHLKSFYYQNTYPFILSLNSTPPHQSFSMKCSLSFTLVLRTWSWQIKSAISRALDRWQDDEMSTDLLISHHSSKTASMQPRAKTTNPCFARWISSSAVVQWLLYCSPLCS